MQHEIDHKAHAQLMVERIAQFQMDPSPLSLPLEEATTKVHTFITGFGYTIDKDIIREALRQILRGAHTNETTETERQ